MDNEKKVLIPLDEYEDLVRTKEDFKKIQKEFEKDCEERGLYMKYELVFRPSILYSYPTTDDAVKVLSPKLTSYAKDEAMQEVQKEMERISSAAKIMLEEKDKEIKRLKEENKNLKGRGLWDRIRNKF